MRKSATLLPGQTFEPERLYDPAGALAAYRSAVPLGPLGSERVPLDEADGRVLAEDARADADYPSHRRSTMDGFAVRAGAEAYTVVAEIRMGHAPPRALAPGEAMRIPTGGALPDGADAVVPVEDVREREDGATVTIELAGPLAPGENFTPVAADMRRGEVVLSAGRRIGAPELGVLATLGMTEPLVYRRPRVAIISTGDELVDAGATPGIGQVRDSNRYGLAGSLRAMGAEPLQMPRAPDTLDGLRAALEAALAAADAVLLSGGSSVGARDLAPDVIEAFGPPGVVVHGLRVKPGKPTVLAAAGAKPVFGLPGNPASSLTILEAVVAPLIRALTGDAGGGPRPIRARATEPFRGRRGWTWYVPARLERGAQGWTATPIAIRSALTALLARGSGYVIVHEDASEVPAGGEVDVVPFSSGGA
jgi:molybdopterin molybdotransferase